MVEAGPPTPMYQYQDPRLHSSSGAPHQPQPHPQHGGGLASAGPGRPGGVGDRAQPPLTQGGAAVRREPVHDPDAEEAVLHFQGGAGAAALARRNPDPNPPRNHHHQHQPPPVSSRPLGKRPFPEQDGGGYEEDLDPRVPYQVGERIWVSLADGRLGYFGEIGRLVADQRFDYLKAQTTL